MQRSFDRHFLTPILLASICTACARDLPDPASPTYAETVTAFYRGVAAAQVGELGLAEASFQQVVDLAPGEPAGWADLGVVALQRREYAQATERLAEARGMTPADSRIWFLSAVVERDKGDVDQAVVYLRRAVELDPANLKARFLLAGLLEQAQPDNSLEARETVDRLLDLTPTNLVVLLERARLAAKLRDLPALRETLDIVAERVSVLSTPITDQVGAVLNAAEDGEFERAATEIAFLSTELQSLPAFRDDQLAVITSPNAMDLVIERFARLPNPSAQSAPPDTGLGFDPESLAVAPQPLTIVRGFWLSEEVPLAIVGTNRETVWVSTDIGRTVPYPFPGAATAQPVLSASVAPLDFDYDFRMDLVLAGPAGLRLLRQNESGAFEDVTRTALPANLVRVPYAGAWVADLDMEGDVDIILGAVDGSAVALRNLGDGRFERYAEFPNVERLRDFKWADVDGDGDPDAVLLDAAGRLHMFVNQRQRVDQFQNVALPDTLGSVFAIASADLNQDATLDVAVLQSNGVLIRLSLQNGSWETKMLARLDDLDRGDNATGLLFVADLDNNGELDIVASAEARAHVWLSPETGAKSLGDIPMHVTDVVDVTQDGRLDLIGVSPDGQSRLLRNVGAADYFSTTIRPRAAQATGDRRINSFGIGGEIEIRAGLLYEKKLIDAPVIHFGLGTRPQVDVARIIWPNGSVQAEFNLVATNEAVLTQQRLKGSCPWVFTYDGNGMQFVTDFIWRSALGLRINAQGAAAVIHSEDWIKIRGDQLAPRDGFYDVRITAELWETHFFDHVSLMVVDHPEHTEVFVDERFTLPPPETAVHVTEPVQPVRWARDQSGRDVTGLVRARDEQYVDTFALGPYQGIASEHYVEVSLGDGVPEDGPLWLVASGWVYPTDASINVASSQGSQPAPHGLILEVPDGNGGWTVRTSDLGFPAGKTKTILIDLQHAFLPGTPRQLRLRTNMEIYWDQIGWATGRPDDEFTAGRLLPETAELRYRGFSEVTAVARSTPERPDYDRIASTAPIWRDLVGFHTRFGDVRPLLEAVDDRYTIMNAGDELLLRFPAQPAPRAGWIRDFVLIGDGWVKDGDYNTGFSTTVLPLPYHGMKDYDRAPRRLEDDPAYRLHPNDWRVFHTRYVTPREFHRALVSHDR